MKRRAWIKGAVTAMTPPAWVNGCTVHHEPAWSGRWLGDAPARGHALRDGHAPAAACAGPNRRVSVAIVGGGIAGLSAARALRQRGIDDFVVLELEDVAGGNSRGHTLAGVGCPLGAHYLPTPGEAATEVSDWLHEIGVARQLHGRTVYDERMLCHSPQERLFVPAAAGSNQAEGHWQDGLLPRATSEPARQQYRRFAQAVRAAQALGPLAFVLPTLRARWNPALTALDQQTFAAWLHAQGLNDAHLLWYLDYCCRDDFGAGLAQVSAWAGLHYFASRHGFRAPGDDEAGDASDEGGILTWPQGNAWLVRQLAQPLGERLRTSRVVTRISPGRHDVTLDVWQPAQACLERWTAQQVIVALPLFVAARVIDAQPAALGAIAPLMRYAPWLVSNLHLRESLLPRTGPPLAWDNVIAGSPALGYVNAQHQSLTEVPEARPTVLTHYWALGGNSTAELSRNRQRLLQEPWQTWAQAVVADLATAHPDLPHQLEHIDLMRHGHAMCVPVPGLRSHPALQALAAPQGRLHFAHSDLSAYSVFEEAFTRGWLAANAAGPRDPG
jgi:monoamine oxidase